MKTVGRPFDMRSLLTSSNNSVPYFYFLLLTSTVISVGVSYARLLTQGKHPIIKRILSLKFLKILSMLILKFMIQSYFLSMAVKSLMYKFVSKVELLKIFQIHLFLKKTYKPNKHNERIILSI